VFWSQRSKFVIIKLLFNQIKLNLLQSLLKLDGVEHAMFSRILYAFPDELAILFQDIEYELNVQKVILSIRCKFRRAR
jgi:hypothetical protein